MKNIIMTLSFSFINILYPLNAESFIDTLLEENHSVLLTKSPDETHQWKLRLIEAAEDSLEISAGYSHGHVFQEVIDALNRKLKSNPKIKIHALFFKFLNLITEDNIYSLSRIQLQYPNRFDFQITEDSSLLNQEGKAYITENHTKLIIVDEKYLLLGGTNLVDTLSTKEVGKYPIKDSPLLQFLPLASLDSDVVIRGTIVNKFRKEFFELYSLMKSGESLENACGDYTPVETAYTPIASNKDISFFENHPDTVHGVKIFGAISGPRMRLHTIGNCYETLIQNAHSSIDIGNMYFFPRDSIYEAMIAAVNRDIAFTIVSNGSHEQASTNNSSRSLYSHINRLNYFPIMSGKKYRIWELFSALSVPQKNSRVYELAMPEVLYHKKVMTVDGLYTIVGSYNLGMKSEEAAYEAAVVIESPSIAEQMRDLLISDQSLSEEIPYYQAMGWYFDPYYNIIETIERKIVDGILLQTHIINSL